MKNQFESQNHFSKKVLEMTLPASFEFSDLKSFWLKKLRFWHTPYRLFLRSSQSLTQEQVKELEKLVTFFKGFHLKDCFLLSPQKDLMSDVIQCFSEEKTVLHRLRLSQNDSKSSDWIITNHFEQNLMEIEEAPPIPWDINQVQKKIFSELRHWHAPFCLIWNYENPLPDELIPSLQKLQKLLRGFHCLHLIFYSNQKISLPPRREEDLIHLIGRHAALEKAQNLLSQSSYLQFLQRSSCSN